MLPDPKGSDLGHKKTMCKQQIRNGKCAFFIMLINQAKRIMIKKQNFSLSIF